MFLIEFFKDGEKIYDVIARKNSPLHRDLIPVFHREMNYLMARGNKTHQEWVYKNDPKFFVLKVSQDDVENWLNITAKNYENTNSFIILDDCASCQSVKNRTSSLVEFAFHGRHAGFPTVLISEHFRAITPLFRDNVQHVLVFYTLDESDWEAVLKSFFAATNEKTAQRNLRHLGEHILLVLSHCTRCKKSRAAK